MSQVIFETFPDFEVVIKRQLGKLEREMVEAKQEHRRQRTAASTLLYLCEVDAIWIAEEQYRKSLSQMSRVKKCIEERLTL